MHHTTLSNLQSFIIAFDNIFNRVRMEYGSFSIPITLHIVMKKRYRHFH